MGKTDVAPAWMIATAPALFTATSWLARWEIFSWPLSPLIMVSALFYGMFLERDVLRPLAEKRRNRCPCGDRHKRSGDYPLPTVKPESD